MADIQSNIRVNIDTNGALASLKVLQGQISAFHQQMSRSGALAASEMSKLQNGLMNSLNRSGQFDARMKTIKTTTESFTEALEKNKLSMGQYFRYAGAATKDFGRLFKGEFDTIEKVARERVKDLQTQYIKMGRDASGAMKAISIRPLVLDLEDAATKAQIAAQKQQLLNQLLKQGSTNMLNWGKNTQWAGRQLMVGFTVPLTMLGQVAAKTFMDMEQQALRFQRVYGDFGTTAQQTKEMSLQVTELAKSFTKYGVAVSDTMGMAADAAAMGKQGADLLAQIDSATKLSILGGIDQKQALETTISLTNAFGIAADQLSNKINFLNVVENQTVTSIDDLTVAIPKAAPVIKQLGGNVEDLAFFLTAMKEGGINASEGANALKSGIASIINPTKKASDMLSGFGINIKGIVTANKGNVRGMVMGVAEALNRLDPLKRAQAIEQLFGKFQFARISTLFKNITDVNSQASKVADLAGQGPEAAAILAQREMKKIEESPMFKFKKALEDLKVELIPLGEQFLKMVTPIAEFFKGMLTNFNNLSGGTKDVIGNITMWLAGFGPVLLMTIGLVANGIANIIKMFAMFKSFVNGMGKGTQNLGTQTDYMTSQQIEAASVASSLDQVHAKLKQTFTAEASAIALLRREMEKATIAQQAFGWSAPTTPVAGVKTGRRKMKGGGMVVGPGGPKDDLVPTDLSNGEAVIDASTVKKNPRIIGALFAGQKINIPGYANNNSDQFPTYTNAVALLGSDTNQKLKGGGVPAAQLASEIKALGPGMNAPIVEAVARALGAKNNKQIVAMLQSDPRLREFATDIQLGVAKAVEAQGGKVDDPALGKIYQDVARKEAAKRGKQFAQATETFLTQPTTIEDSTIRRISSSDPNKTRAVGRKSLFSGVRSYRSINYRPIASELGTNPDGLVKAHMSDRVFMNIRQTAAQLGLKLSAAAEEAAVRMESGIVKTYQSISDGVKKATRQASPSKDAHDAGANIGIGAIQGIKEGGKGAKAAGREVGASVRTQAQQDALMVANRTRSAYANDSGLKNLAIQKKQAEMMGADTAWIEREIAARKALVAAQVKAAIATEASATAAATRSYGLPEGFSAPLPAGVQGPIGPNDKRKGTGFMSKVGGKIAAGFRRTGGMGIAMGTTMLMGGLSQMKGPVGQVAGQLMGPVSAMAGALAMLPGPLGWVTAGLIGLVSVVDMVNKAKEEENKKALALGKAMSASTKDVIEWSKATGKVTATEKRRQAQATAVAGYNPTSASSQFATQFMGTDTGKSFLSDAQLQLSSGFSSQDVGTNLSQQLGYQIAQGSITTEQAKALAKDIGDKLHNQSITAQIIGNINSIFGPNGENLAKDPLKITVQLQQQQSAGQQTILDMSTFQTQEQADATNFGWQNFFDAISGTETHYNVGDLDPSKIADAKAAMQGQLQTYSANQGNLDIINETFDKLVAQAKTQEEINALEERRTSALNKQVTANNKNFKNLKDARDLMNTRGNYDTDVFKPALADALKGTAFETKANDLADLINGIENKDVRLRVQAEAVSGELDPTFITKLSQLAKNDAFATNYNILVDTYGDAKAIELVQSLANTGLSDNKITAEVTLVLNGTQSIESVLAAYNQINQLQSIGITIDVNADNAQAELQQFKMAYDDISNKTKGKQITAKFVTDYIEDKDAAKVINHSEVFNKLPKKGKIYYLAQYQAIVKTGVNGVFAKPYAEWQKTHPFPQYQFSDFAAELAGQSASAASISGAFDGGSNDQQNANPVTASDKANAALSIMGRKEDKINKAYDERIKALDKIEKANERINQQKKDQLDLADALSRGDIGAAARAQQQARQNAMNNALQDQKDNMSAARDAQIASLRVNGMSRAQLESFVNKESDKTDKATLGKWKGAIKRSIGGMVPNVKYLSAGDLARGTDTVAAMLTPGEFVVKKSAVDSIGVDNMHKINKGQIPAKAGSVYNYSINVNVKSDADADQIANVVLTKIQSIDNQGMKGDDA